MKIKILGGAGAVGKAVVLRTDTFFDELKNGGGITLSEEVRYHSVLLER